jgi:hypothetical protein
MVRIILNAKLHICEVDPRQIRLAAVYHYAGRGEKSQVIWRKWVYFPKTESHPKKRDGRIEQAEVDRFVRFEQVYR